MPRTTERASRLGSAASAGGGSNRTRSRKHDRHSLEQQVSFIQAEDGIRDADVTGVQTCALPICQAPQGTHHDARRTSTSGAGTRRRRPVWYSSTASARADCRGGATGPPSRGGSVTADIWRATAAVRATSSALAQAAPRLSRSVLEEARRQYLSVPSP